MSRILTPLMCLVPALALGQSVGGPVSGTPVVVNNSAGDQTDPHVSGARVAYTHQPSRSVSEIHYQDLVSREDKTVPSEGALDTSPDVLGNRIVFTRGGSRIYAYDVTAGSSAQELAPRTDVDRRTASIGGSIVAWQERGYTARTSSPEIFAWRTDTLALTRLTEDTSVDSAPAVSSDGQALVWTKCATAQGKGCDIWSARVASGGYESFQLTGAEGEESQPDTNGSVAVYVTDHPVNSTSETDIAWQPVEGGEARVLSLPGADTHPNISGPLVAFEHWNASSATPNFDVVLYDLRTQTYYQLTDTSGSESLSDISLSPDGVTRVVWAVRQNGDLNVYSLAFRLPIDCPTTPPQQAASVCDAPGARPLLGSLQLVRSASQEVDTASALFEAKGTGVLCVDNGQGGTRATSGEVYLGEGLAVAEDEFGEDVAQVSRAVPLQGRRTLSAALDGPVGSAFQVRLYGELSCSMGLTDASAPVSELPPGRGDPPRIPGCPGRPGRVDAPLRPGRRRGESSGGTSISVSSVARTLLNYRHPEPVHASPPARGHSGLGGHARHPGPLGGGVPRGLRHRLGAPGRPGTRPRRAGGGRVRPGCAARAHARPAAPAHLARRAGVRRAGGAGAGRGGGDARRGPLRAGSSGHAGVAVARAARAREGA